MKWHNNKRNSLKKIHFFRCHHSSRSTSHCAEAMWR